MSDTSPPTQKVLKLKIEGDLLSTTIDRARVELKPILDLRPEDIPPWDQLLLDLSTAKMVDSVGLNLIVTTFRSVQKAGKTMRITYTSPSVHRTFLFTRLDKYIELTKL